MKTKTKLYGDKVSINFQGERNCITKRKCIILCLSLIMLDSVIRINKKYHPQILLEECKYEIKRIKWRI